MRLAATRFAALNLVAATLFAALGAGTAHAAPFECREARMAHAATELPKTLAKLARKQPLDILAIGSSSTEGVGASTRDKTYPARLQTMLRQAWPGVTVNIANAGIGGETAPQTILRLRKALADRTYDLVIWQVGTNDAVKGGDLDAFKAMVAEGIAAVRTTGTDLVVLDPQFFPSVREPELYRRFVDAIAQTAQAEKVPVFSRYDTMRSWYQRDAAAFATTLWTDNFHMSDTGYDCLARGMAGTLVEMTGPMGRLVASSGR